MKNLLVKGLAFFTAQTFMEIICIVVLVYLGIPYFEISVGNEPFTTVIVGVIGYFAIFKVIYYSWIYVLAFIAIGMSNKSENVLFFSILNFLLSLIYVLFFLIIGRTLSSIIDSIIATIIAAAIIMLYNWKMSPNSSSFERSGNEDVK